MLADPCFHSDLEIFFNNDMESDQNHEKQVQSSKFSHRPSRVYIHDTIGYLELFANHYREKFTIPYNNPKIVDMFFTVQNSIVDETLREYNTLFTHDELVKSIHRGSQKYQSWFGQFRKYIS
jgi:hypothetical protein